MTAWQETVLLASLCFLAYSPFLLFTAIRGREWYQLIRIIYWGVFLACLNWENFHPASFAQMSPPRRWLFGGVMALWLWGEFGKGRPFWRQRRQDLARGQ